MGLPKMYHCLVERVEFRDGETTRALEVTGPSPRGSMHTYFGPRLWEEMPVVQHLNIYIYVLQGCGFMRDLGFRL